MSLARVGFVRQVLKNAVRRPAKQPKRDCGYIYRETDSVKEAAHEYYVPEYKEHVRKGWKEVLMFTVPLVSFGVTMGLLTEEHPHGNVEYMPFDYMYYRKSRFPWGDGNHSLFHHPQNNCLPGGWTEEE